MSAVARARSAIDAVHRRDPAGAEQAWADAVEAWTCRLLPDCDDTARLAARCQHLERWAIPRSDYPSGRAGYNRWRHAVHERQGELAERLCREAGIPAEDAAAIRAAVAKHRPLGELGQALEDAACLVFFERQAADFVADKGYDDAKAIDIIRKTWRKMSPAAHQAALALELPPALHDLVARALAPTPDD